MILRPVDGLCSFSKDNSADFLVKKKCNEAFRGVYNLRIRRKRKVKSCTRGRRPSPSNLS